MEFRQLFLLAAFALAGAVCGQEFLEDCDEGDDDYPPSPDLVPRIPGSSPPVLGRQTFSTAVLGQACVGVSDWECGRELYCETTTQACQRRLPLGAECDPSLAIQNCFELTPEGLGFVDIPPWPGAVCVAQANGRGKCVPTVVTGTSCADPAAGGCFSPELCDAGICAEELGGRLTTCASDSDCGRDVCRAALDGRKRCVFLQRVGGSCLGAVGRVSFAACPAGTACDARTNKCMTDGVTLAIGENCFDDQNDQVALCDSGDNALQATCPFRQEGGRTLQSQCELDLTGKRCSGDGDCISGGTTGFECDFGVCAKIPLCCGDGNTKGHLGSCGSDGQCRISSNNQILVSRCTLADDGVNRCLHERQIGDSCAPVGDLVRDFVCAAGTRCHAPSQTCVRDVAPVGVGQPCGTTARVQFVACVEGSSCGSQVNSDGFRQCV